MSAFRMQLLVCIRTFDGNIHMRQRVEKVLIWPAAMSPSYLYLDYRLLKQATQAFGRSESSAEHKYWT